jgi:hypothetical protein
MALKVRGSGMHDPPPETQIRATYKFSISNTTQALEGHALVWPGFVI